MAVGDKVLVEDYDPLVDKYTEAGLIRLDDEGMPMDGSPLPAPVESAE